jgi:NAD(P)-dependent dehydrogenase (short-subunit alcohol dehydrogenase family)
VSLDPKVEGRQAVEAQYAGLSPMRRIGDPVEAAAAVVWLCLMPHPSSPAFR